jgi:hypothetical protein
LYINNHETYEMTMHLLREYVAAEALQRASARVQREKKLAAAAAVAMEETGLEPLVLRMQAHQRECQRLLGDLAAPFSTAVVGDLPALGSGSHAPPCTTAGSAYRTDPALRVSTVAAGHGVDEAVAQLRSVVALGSETGAVLFAHAATGRIFACGLGAHTQRVQGVAVASRPVLLPATAEDAADASAEGKAGALVVSTSRDGSIAVWAVPLAWAERDHDGMELVTPIQVVAEAHGVMHAPKSDSVAKIPSEVLDRPPRETWPCPVRRCCINPAVPALFLTCGDDGAVRMWDITGIRWAGAQAGPRTFVRSATSHSFPFELIADAALAPVGVLFAFCGPVCDVAFQPDGALFTAVDSTGAASLWDARSGACLWTSGALARIAAGVDEAAEPASFWRQFWLRGGAAEPGAPVAAYALHAASATSVAWSPNGFIFCTGGKDGMLVAYNARRLKEQAGAVLWTSPAHGDAISDIAFVPLAPTPALDVGGAAEAAPALFLGACDACCIASVGLDGRVVFTDAWTGVALWRISGDGIGGIERKSGGGLAPCPLQPALSAHYQMANGPNTPMVPPRRAIRALSFCSTGESVDLVTVGREACFRVFAQVAEGTKVVRVAAATVGVPVSSAPIAIVAGEDMDDDEDSDEDAMAGLRRKR